MKLYTLHIDLTPAAFVIGEGGIPKFKLRTSLDIQVTGKGSTCPFDLSAFEDSDD